MLMLLPAALCGLARADGERIYDNNCIICHQPDGNGVAGMYPPLADSIGRYVAIPAGRAYLVHVVSFGLNGRISVHRVTYDGVMYPWPQLSDEEVADVLNYVLTTFNEKLLAKPFSPLTANEVKKYRARPTALGSVHDERAALMKALHLKQR